MNRITRTLAVSFALAGVALFAHAQSPQAPGPGVVPKTPSPQAVKSPGKAVSKTEGEGSAVPQALTLALKSGLKLETRFKAAGGMTGWVVSEGPGKSQILFSPPDGTVLIAGVMVDAAGKNLTNEYTALYAPKLDYDKAWARLEKSAFVSEGPADDKAKSVIYVFSDANCSFCHLAWLALAPYAKAGLQVRWIPVAFLGADSYNKAAYQLTAKDPSEAMAKSQAAFGTRAPDVAVAVSPEMRITLNKNNALMHELGFQGTPALLYKNAQGKVVAVNGMFRMSQLPEITGLPAQANNDPALARFR